MYRDACSNLAMLRSVKETYQTIRHTSGLRLAMDELVSQFQTLKEGWQTLTNLVESMEAAEVNLAEFLDQVYVPDPEADARAIRKAATRTAKPVVKSEGVPSPLGKRTMRFRDTNSGTLPFATREHRLTVSSRLQTVRRLARLSRSLSLPLPSPRVYRFPRKGVAVFL